MPRLAVPAFRLLATTLSPAGHKARLSILIYHRVLPETDPLFPHETTAETFEAQTALFKSVFNVLPLPEAVSRLKAGTLPARPACITFDDRYIFKCTHVLPIYNRCQALPQSHYRA